MLLYLVLDISTYHVLVLLLRPHICLLWQREVIDEPSTVCLLPPFFLKKKVSWVYPIEDGPNGEYGIIFLLCWLVH